MANNTEHSDSQNKINQLVKRLPLDKIENLDVPSGEKFSVEAEHCRIERMVLNEGSVIEVRTDIYPISALSIGELVINPGSKGSEIRFASQDRFELDGVNGRAGRNGRRAQGVSGRGGDGEDGENGENGETVFNRGTLWLTVQNLSVPANRPLDATVLRINANGLNGGNGGNGGAGGDGADGGKGRNGAHRCGIINCWCRRKNVQSGSGGNAGSGGKPGDAGGAGSGGHVLFTGDPELFKKLEPVVSCEVGSSGMPGHGGVAGKIGEGGPSHHGGRKGGCRGKQPGKNGAPGTDRGKQSGGTGPDGSKGSFSLKSSYSLEQFVVDAYEIFAVEA